MNQWRKGIASWTVGKTLYLSVPFTWLMGDAEDMAREWKGRVVAGGPAVKLLGAPWADTPDSVPFDSLSFHNPLATFTTRGCPNKCSFCGVPKIEGDFIELSTWKPAPIVCDNNLLASTHKHFVKVVDSLTKFDFCDFNQGLDARLFSHTHAYEFARLKNPLIRFSWDHVNLESCVKRAVGICNVYGFRVQIYVLIGYKDDPISARYRLETVRSWGLLPNPMRYQPLDAKVKNEFVGENWDGDELKRMHRYYSRLNYLEHIPYEDYQPEKTTQTNIFYQANRGEE